jgi:hypothetical protein
MDQDEKPEVPESEAEKAAQPDAAPVQVDEDWRKAELEKMMFGEEKKSSAGKIIGVIGFVLVVALVGWLMFGQAAPPAPQNPVAAADPAGGALDTGTQMPPPPPRPPIPQPEPRPHRDLFEVQTNFDGQQVIVYTIQPSDTLFRIGEKLHEVTGFPRLITHQAVEDAYWRKYFSYDEQNAAITSDDQVADRVGEIIMIPLPLDEYPDFDLAAKIEEYNQS